MRSRIATVLAVPLLALALLVAGAGPASAETDTMTGTKTLVSHVSRQLQFQAPAGAAHATGAAAAESCLWDTYIYRADATGALSAETGVVCNAPMYQISVQAQRLINGNAVPESNRISHRYGYQNNLVTTPPSACIPGVNKSYGSVLVVNFAGFAASAFGESLNTITC